MKEININSNRYNLEAEKIKQIEDMLNNFLLKLERDINQKSFDEKYISEYLAIIGECFEFLRDKKKWLNISYRIMECLRAKLYREPIDMRIDLFGGLIDVGVSINHFYSQTNQFGKFVKKYNILLLHVIKEYLILCNSSNYQSTQHYDVISGLSGAGFFLLDNFYDNEAIPVAMDIARYFVSLVIQEKDYKGKQIPKWHIEQKNIINREIGARFPGGYIDFGLAHGIVGPMVFLAKAYHKNIIVENQMKAIDIIQNIYITYGKEDKGVWRWPTMLAIEKYLDATNIKEERSCIASWCYGTLGISYALHAVGEFIKNQELEDWAYKNLLKLASENIESYAVISPIICHGYAGILATLDCMFRQKQSEAVQGRIKELIDILIGQYDVKSKYGFIDRWEESKNNQVLIRLEETNDFLNGTSGILLVLLSVLKKKPYFPKHLYLF